MSLARRALLACALLIAGTGTARADDASARRAAAEALFERGRALVEQGQFAEGCSKLAESQRLEPGTGTLLWLADCYENNGQTASAWATFKAAAASAATNRDRRELVARERARRLEPTLCTLMVNVPAEASAQGVQVTRDGIAVGPAEWGVPIPTDPGVHAIAATAVGRRDWTATVTLAAKQCALQVTVPALAPAAPVAAGVAPPGPPAPPVQALEPPRREGTVLRTLSYVAAGAGVASLAVGGYFAIHAKSVYDAPGSTGDCQPGGACDAAGKSQREAAFTDATVATVLMTAGAVAVAAGVTLYLIKPAPTASVALTGRPGGASAVLDLVW